MNQNLMSAAPSFLFGVLLVLFCSTLVVAIAYTIERALATRASLAWFGFGCIVSGIGVMVASIVMRRQ